MQTQEPKVNVMPSSSAALVKLNDAIESSSKSGRDLDREASLDRFESNPSSPGVARVEVALKTDVLSICLARSGSNDSSTSSMR
jgi:hypothetical protein